VQVTGLDPAAGTGGATLFGAVAVQAVLSALGLGGAAVTGTAAPPGRDVTVTWGSATSRHLSGRLTSRQLGVAAAMRDLVTSLEG
jgi:hypothetical protein